MAENEFDTREVNNCSQNGGFNETVCIDAQRVYDSCGDKDCLEDLEVYFTPPTQNIIDKATNVRLRDDDEYAKWAAEAAAKATSGEFPASAPAAPKPAPRKPIPMPMPSALKPKKS